MTAAIAVAAALLAAAALPPPPPIIPPPGPAGTNVCFEPEHPAWEVPARPGARNSFAGRDTGAWSMTGKSGRSVPGGYFTSMSDTNPYRRGTIYAVVEKFADGSISLVVGAAGAERQHIRGWDGRGWNRLPRARRSATVKAGLVRFARASAGECGGRLESLRDEIATFDRAFAVLDGWRP